MGELRLRGETMENVIENKAPVGAEQQKPAKKKKPAKTIAAAVLDHMIVILFATFIVVPLYIVVITSVKTSVEANGTHFYWWPQLGFSLEGYKTVLTTSSTARNLVRAFGVTLWMYGLPAL